MLKEVVTLVAQFDADEQLDIVQRQHRDREIGRELSSLKNKPLEQIRAWLNQAASKDANTKGEQTQKASGLVSMFSIVLGLLLGWGTALAVFYYDGSRPVNVINVLAVFVFLQVLLLTGFLLACLPRGMMKYAPGFTALQDALQSLNPGRLVSTLSRYLPQSKRNALHKLTTDTGRYQRSFTYLKKWMILYWSQLFALAFNIGAILCALYLVVFSDLAFGWSTTLKIESGSFHSITTWLASPWQVWLADGTPALQLVENTRYFRLDEGLLPNAKPDESDPALLGQWWPFLLLCMLFYGLLPRVLTTIYASQRLRTATNRSILRLPESADLLERLNSPEVETTATEPETGTILEIDKGDTQPLVELQNRDCILIDWANAIANRLTKQQAGELCGVNISTQFSAGGKNTLAEDQKIIEQIHGLTTPMPVIVLVKAWEPPMLELLDFINELQSVETPQKCIVIPISFNQENKLIQATKSQLESWHQALYRLFEQRVSMHVLHEAIE